MRTSSLIPEGVNLGINSFVLKPAIPFSFAATDKRPRL